jgi:hypothetical protein
MGRLTDLLMAVEAGKPGLQQFLMVAKRLTPSAGFQKIAAWIENELKGYPHGSGWVPDYRHIETKNLGRFREPDGTVNPYYYPLDLQLVPESLRGSLAYCGITLPAAQLEEKERGGHDLMAPWHPDVIARYPPPAVWKSYTRSGQGGEGSNHRLPARRSLSASPPGPAERRVGQHSPSLARSPNRPDKALSPP